MTDFGRRVAIVAANVLPKTGQTTSYPEGDETDRDDGHYQAGWEGERFTDNGDGTITDNATSLMWPKDAADAGLEMEDRDWAPQIAHIEGLTFAGYSDWRMCNVVELESIIDRTLYSATINSIIQNAQKTFPWTSTTVAEDDTLAVLWIYNVPWFTYMVKASPTVSMCVRSVG